MKYTPQQLRTKAVLVLFAKEQGDRRYLRLLMQLSTRLSLSPHAVASHIRQLAR